MLRSGILVVSWFNLDLGLSTAEALEQTGNVHSAQVVDSWVRHYRKIPREYVERYYGWCTRRSTDGGNTWEEAVANLADTPHGPTELSDGRLVPWVVAALRPARRRLTPRTAP